MDTSTEKYEYDDPEGSWEFALNKAERSRLAEFSAKDAHRCWDLGQSEKRPCSSHVGEALHTLIRGMGLLWLPVLNPPRWWAASELALAMGFPVKHELATATGAIEFH